MLIFTKTMSQMSRQTIFQWLKLKVLEKVFIQMLHLNIRSMKKNFESFKELSKNLIVSFSAICLSDIWCESQRESQNLNYIFQAITVFPA